MTNHGPPRRSGATGGAVTGQETEVIQETFRRRSPTCRRSPRWHRFPTGDVSRFCDRLLALVFLLASIAALAGCGAGQTGPGYTSAGDRAGAGNPYVIERCQLDVTLEPSTHRLEATGVLDVADHGKFASPNPGKLRLRLHRDLGVDRITSSQGPVTFVRLPDAPATTQKSGDDEDDEAADRAPAAAYELTWAPPRGQSQSLTIRYGGVLKQDVAVGEKPGEIHNFQMHAHIGPDGIYLAEDGLWYPQIADADSDSDQPNRREASLTVFELTANEAPGMILVAGGNRDGAAINRPRGPRTTWRTPFAVQGLALAGGPHQVFQRQVGDVLVSIHVSSEHGAFAPGILDALESYLRLYEPLIGKYPYAEFTVVENFFSSGFAYPGFTLLAPAVIAMGPMGLQPGYLDHELLHNWWGNGVFVSELDGNWCESVTSYCANYMRHILEGRLDKARAQRRDTCYALSRLPPEKDKPLATFGRPKGAGRLIGYQKGTVVLAMLADKIGQENMWRAWRRLYTEHLGKPAGWNDLRGVFEQQSGQALGAFFDQWIYGAGLPTLTVDEASYDQQARRLSAPIMQGGERSFELTVPLRLVYDDGFADELAQVRRPAQVAVIKTLTAPTHVELDPDFHLLRRVVLEDVMPTISGITDSQPLLIVKTAADYDAYKPTADQLKDRYSKSKDTIAREIDAGELAPDDLKHGHVVFLGQACLSVLARQALKDKPLTCESGLFVVQGQRYDQPTDEVLCCLQNESDPGGVLCFYFGNDAAQLKKARVVTFYGGNSLVVFRNGQAVFRQDFEKTGRVAVVSEG